MHIFSVELIEGDKQLHVSLSPTTQIDLVFFSKQKQNISNLRFLNELLIGGLFCLLIKLFQINFNLVAKSLYTCTCMCTFVRLLSTCA